LTKPQTEVVYSGNLPGMLSLGDLCLGFITVIISPALGAYAQNYLLIWKTRSFTHIRIYQICLLHDC